MAGRKVFTSGEILTSADVNSFLMDQSVMVFADSTARSSAIPTPTEGMVTYREDANRVEVYDGSAFGAIGGILQVVQGTFSTTQTTTSSTFVDTGLTVNITPSSTSSKIFVIGNVRSQVTRTGAQSTGNGRCAIDRDSGTVIAESAFVHLGVDSGTRVLGLPASLSVLDSPATTSSVVYTWQHRTESTSTTMGSFIEGSTGFLVAMEVAV